MLVLAIVFFLLLLSGFPIGLTMGLSSMVYLLLIQTIPYTVIPQVMVNSTDSFSLMAIPFFLLAGELMNSSGITHRIFDFAKTLIGHIKGGLGHVNVLASVIFSGMSGSAVADASGLGVIEIEAMKDGGYDSGFAAAVTASSATIGPIIPPSIPMVIVGSIMQISIGKLFIGGIIPGILMAVGMMILIYFIALKRKFPHSSTSSVKEIFISFFKAFPALLTPIILVGGILGGVFTPTEAGAVASVYAIALGLFYKDLDMQKIKIVLKKVVINTSAIMFIIALGGVLGWLLTRAGVGKDIVNVISSISTNPTIALTLIMMMFLVLGCVINPSSLVIMMAPLMIAIIDTYQFDPIHFGVLMVVVIMVGLITPPVGQTLFITASISETDLFNVIKNTFPFIILFALIIILMILFPQIITYLPEVL